MQGKKSMNSLLLILCQILPLFYKQYKALWRENLTVYHQALGPFFLASFNPSPFHNSYFPFCTNIIQIWWIIIIMYNTWELNKQRLFEWCMSTRSGLFLHSWQWLCPNCPASCLCKNKTLRKTIFFYARYVKREKTSLWVDVPPFKWISSDTPWPIYIFLSRLLISCLTLSTCLQTVFRTLS